jgi:hypothetical protein
MDLGTWVCCRSLDLQNIKRNIFLKKKSSVTLLFFFCAILTSTGQDFFRFKADFSLKEISSVGDSLERRLVIGTCYYDNNLNKLTYNLRFPHAEQWIVQDTFIYTLREGELINEASVPKITEHNIFKMLLEQTFTEFGMLKSGYQIQKVKKLGNEIFVTYQPPEEHAKVLGSLVLVKEKKMLKGVIYYEPDGNMMFRQQLNNYQVVSGLPVPGEIAHIVEKGDKKIQRILSFDNILINESGFDDQYDVPVKRAAQ